MGHRYGPRPDPARRRLLATGGLVGVAGLASASLSGCDLFSTGPRQQQPAHKSREGRGSGDGKESPMLAGRVAAGDLPPLADRLPAEPLEVEPLEAVGSFGGTLHKAEIEIQSSRNIPIVNHASLVQWGLDDPTEVVPGLAKSWDTDRGTTYRFVLRKGVKWSDGHPFTADDLVFYYRAVVLNKDLTPVPPTWLVSGGRPVRIRKVDAHTVDFEFAEPNGLLLRYLAFPALGISILTPAHYLEQFHPDYAGRAAVDKLVRKSGSNWPDFFLGKNDRWLNPDLPVLGPWRVTQPPSGSNRVIMERNPYFWQVDTDGKQLPYVDRIVHTQGDQETLTLAESKGDIDLQVSYVAIGAMPVLSRNAKAGGYRLHRWTAHAGPFLFTNQSHRDPVVRRLLQNIDFRAGLSHAIDRNEMNKLFYGGTGVITQPLALPEDPYHVAGSGHTFVGHDEAKANALLDRAGVQERDGDGFRLRPDGEQLRLTISTFTFETGIEPADAYGLVKKYWEDVGVRTQVQLIDRTLWSERAAANEFDIAGYETEQYDWDLEPSSFVPTTESCYWGPLFGLWYATGGKQGERPPPELRRLQKLYDRMKAAVDDRRRLALGREIQSIHDRNVWVIGTVGQPFAPVIVNDDLVNVKRHVVEDYRNGHDGVTWLSQVSYRHPDDH